MTDRTDFLIWAAKLGLDKDLDVLVYDPSPAVRQAVAWHGRDKDLDILVNDKSASVRRVVAWYGRDKDLDKLVSDPDADVRAEAQRQLRFLQRWRTK